METNLKKLLFIVNPRSGRTKSRAPLFDAAVRFSQAGYLVHIHMTSGPKDATNIARELGSQFDVVVCAGGDGTLNETIAGLMELPQRPPVGYLPCGSTNDFAASLHIPAQMDRAAESVVQGCPFPLDIGVHNGRHFAYVASFGAFTRSSYSAPQATKNALGHFAYILEGLGDLNSLRPYRCRIIADGEIFEGDFIFGAVCNTTSLAGMVKLNPSRVSMNDGQFELLLLQTPKTPLDLQNLIVALTSMEYDYPGVYFRHVRSVTMETDEDIPWSLDGEYAPSAPRVEIRNLPGAIELMLRRNANAN
ncbi:MAG: YegS/Rv2252/BmrU family lipid kinase [Ruminococcaceae bacterium]|jgi:YegS/Rv2252/BmrU family lipid kinase|nr:YegS/Rv2252/BmrU family lipid kinase [Oscillospiraceae bacterium]